MMLPPTRVTRSQDGLDIAYQVFGDGPDLVFVHRYVSTIGYMWDVPPFARFLDRLGETCRVLALDPRGAGLSDRTLPSSQFALEARMLDLLAVMDAESIEHASFLGAEDGGSLSALFAASHPQRVDRLILHATYARGEFAEDYPFPKPGGWDAFIDEGEQRWGTEWMDEQARDIAPSASEDPDVRRRIINLYRLGATRATAVKVWAVARDLDIRSVLPTIQAPTLVLHPMNATEDSLGPPEQSRYLADQIPDARYVEVSGGDFEIYSGDVGGVLDEIEEFLTGARRVPDANRVLATVLFTDIVDSTRRAAELGDARWKALLAEHDERARAEITTFRGRYINTTGDGLLATFDGPARAVRCAGAIRDAVDPLGLTIRSGCHTGEIELADDDVRGIAVHICARVAALARPSEVLVSSTVKDLVAGSGLTFEDAREHELKGVPDRWHLYRVAD